MRTELIKAYYDSEEYLAKLKHKVEILKQMERDEFFRADRIASVYAVDPVAFIEDCLLLKFVEFGGDPKSFFMFDYQKNIIRKLHEWEMSGEEIEGLVDKPRGMGLTWIVCAYFIWRFLFTPNWSAFVLSRTEEEVDDGTDVPENSIFAKIRWMMKRMPHYMLPAGFKFKVARGTPTDMALKILNPVNGSAIIGSSTNSNAGRSRRYRLIFIDEAFAIDHFSEVYRSLQSVAMVKIFVSTVQYGFAFENLKKKCDAMGTYISLTWRDHPFKDETWYQAQLAKAEAMDDPDLLREVKPEYAVSSKVQYYPQISEAKVLPCPFTREFEIYVGLDFGGRQDYTVIIYAQWYDGILHVIDAYWNTNKPTEWYASFLNPEALYNATYFNEYQQKFIEKFKTWKKPSAFFGELDHTIKRRPDNRSDQDALAKHGVRIQYNPYAIEHEPRRFAVQTFLPRTVFNSESDAAMKIYDAIANSRYANINRSTTEQLKPIHDPQIADMRAAFENLCVNMGRILRHKARTGEGVHNGSDSSFTSNILKRLRV